MRINVRVIAGLLAIGFAAVPCSAVVIFDGPGQNIGSPGGVGGSGWDYQGTWAGFSATAIAPNYIIAANHIDQFGLAVGSSFVSNFNGQSYVTDATIQIPGTDLRLYHTVNTLPAVAPLYQGSDEDTKPLYVFGRGVARGNTPADEVIVSGELKGWLWDFDPLPAMSWGQNTAIIDEDNNPEYVLFDWTSVTGQNEGHVIYGDSSGGLFIQEDGVWKLAGVNSGSEFQYSYTANGPTFNAAIFDKGGLYQIVDGDPPPDDRVFIDDEEDDIPAYGYSSRISYNLPFINSATGLPEPSSALSILATAAVIALRRRSAGSSRRA